MAKFAKGNNLKKLIFSPGYLLIILYQLTKFEAPSNINFQNSLIISFLMSKFSKPKFN